MQFGRLRQKLYGSRVPDPPEDEFKPAPIWLSARRHPLITSVLVASALAGATLGAVFLADDWSLARRIAAGGVAGAGCGLLMTAYRIIG